MISVLLMVLSLCARAAHIASIQSGLLARTHVRARTHEFNVPKEVDDARNRCRQDPPSNRCRRARAAAASRCGARASTARACSPWRRSPKGEVLIEYKGEVITWQRGAAPPPARPERPAPHLLSSTSTNKHVIDCQVGGNAATLDQPRLRAELRGRRGRRPHLHQGAARRSSRARSCSTTTASSSTSVHAEAEEGVRVPLRHEDCRARCSRRSADARRDARCTGAPKRCGSSSSRSCRA